MSDVRGQGPPGMQGQYGRSYGGGYDNGGDRGGGRSWRGGGGGGGGDFARGAPPPPRGFTRDYQQPGRGGPRGGGGGRASHEAGPPPGPRERGVVVSVRESFGFIKCVGRDEQVFAHVSQIVPPQDSPEGAAAYGMRPTMYELIRQGQEVEFTVGQGSGGNKGRPAAQHVTFLPRGSVKFEEPLPGVFRGIVSFFGANRRGNVSLKGVDQPDQDKRAAADAAAAAAAEEVQKLDVDAGAADEAAAPGGGEGDGGVPPAAGSEQDAPRAGGGQQQQQQQQQQQRESRVPMSVGFDLEADDAEAAEGSTKSPERLHVGDLVEFSIMVPQRADRGRARATNLKLLGVPTQERETGLVTSVGDNFGHIRCADRPEARLWFHFSECCFGESGVRRVKREDEVSFMVVTDPRSGKPVASRLEKLPHGTVKFDESLSGTFTGVVEKDATSGREARNAGIIVYTEGDGDEAKEHRATYTLYDMDNPREAAATGDTVSFQVSVHKQSNERMATAVKVVERKEDETELGVVARLAESYGFIKRCETAADVFFHFSELQDLSPDQLSVGIDLRFSVKLDPRSKRTVAVRVKAAPKGSAVFDTIDEEVLFGTIVRRAGDGSGPGGRGGGRGGRGGRGGASPDGLLERVIKAGTKADFKDWRMKPKEPEEKPAEETAVAAEGDVTEAETAAGAEAEDTEAPAETTPSKAKSEEPNRPRDPVGEPFEDDTGRLIERLPFGRGDLSKGEAYPRPGDWVSFQSAAAKRDPKARRATNVTLRRFKALVKSVGGSFGILDVDITNEHRLMNIRFHVHEVMGDAELGVGDEVEVSLCESIDRHKGGKTFDSPFKRGTDHTAFARRLVLVKAAEREKSDAPVERVKRVAVEGAVVTRHAKRPDDTGGFDPHARPKVWLKHKGAFPEPEPEEAEGATDGADREEACGEYLSDAQQAYA